MKFVVQLTLFIKMSVIIVKGITRLNDKVAVSDEVKKHPLKKKSNSVNQ